MTEIVFGSHVSLCGMKENCPLYSRKHKDQEAIIRISLDNHYEHKELQDRESEEGSSKKIEK
jgi:hypothetical protein